MRMRILVGVGALALLFSGCVSTPAAPQPPVQPSLTPSAPAPSGSSTPTQPDEPGPGQIQWLDGSISNPNPDAGRELFNMLESGGKPPTVKFDALITAAEVTEKEGSATYTLTIDEVSHDNSGNEEGAGYVNPSKKTRQVKVTDPLVLVFPPNLVSPTPQDFVKHLKEFANPFSFYYQGNELVGLVQWYHP